MKLILCYGKYLFKSALLHNIFSIVKNLQHTQFTSLLDDILGSLSFLLTRHPYHNKTLEFMLSTRHESFMRR